jgi:hypothetical protein
LEDMIEPQWWLGDKCRDFVLCLMKMDPSWRQVEAEPIGSSAAGHRRQPTDILAAKTPTTLQTEFIGVEGDMNFCMMHASLPPALGRPGKNC